MSDSAMIISTGRKPRKRQHTQATLAAVVREDNLAKSLQECYRQASKLKGQANKDALRRAISNMSIGKLRHLFLSHEYRPKANTLVEIPKHGAQGVRIIGMPHPQDRIVQTAILQIIAPIAETHISDHAYAYRTGRSTVNMLQAIEAARQMHPNYKYLVKIDLKDFFGSIDQNRLLVEVQNTLSPDPSLMKLLKKIIKESAARDKQGIITPIKRGIVQGSIMAPMLSNIYGKLLDDRILTHMQLYWRYSDDAVCLVQSREEGSQLLKAIDGYCSELGLVLNRDKSKVAEIAGTTLLGATFTEEGLKIPDGKVEEIAVELSENLSCMSEDEVIGKLSQSLAYYYRIHPSLLEDMEMLRKLDRMLTTLGRQWKHWALSLIAEVREKLRSHPHAADTAMEDDMDGFDPSRYECAL